MRILLFFILLFFTSEKPIGADLGLPEIQAVCKVTLKDGKTIEGFITFGNGGYEYKYRPHGFCFKHDNGTKQLILFDFKFNLSNLNSYDSYRNGTSKLYYVENISEINYQQPKTEFNEEENILTVTNTDVRKYKLSEEMVIYKKIPLELYLANSDENGELKIRVDQIKAVELLKEPSKSSLDIIKLAREKQRLAEEKDGYWTDFYAPVWYHEIINDQKMIDYLSQYF